MKNKERYKERRNEIRPEREERINLILQEMSDMRTDVIEIKKQVNTIYDIASEVRREMEKERQESILLKSEENTGLDRIRQRILDQEVIPPGKVLRLRPINEEEDIENTEEKWKTFEGGIRNKEETRGRRKSRYYKKVGQNDGNK